MKSIQLYNNNPAQLDLDVISVLKAGSSDSPLAEKTKELYNRVGAEYNSYLVANSLPISPDSIRTFLLSKEWSESTYNLKLNALIKIVKGQASFSGANPLEIAAIDQAVRQTNKRIKLNKAVEKDGYLTESEMRKFLFACSGKFERTGLIAQLLFKTGCRITEAIGISHRNITIQDGICFILVTGKGSIQRKVFFTEKFYYELRQVFWSPDWLIHTTKGTQFYRQNLWKETRDAGVLSGYEIYPHIFRHSCAMFLKENNKSPQYIQKYLGHKNLETTIKYYFHDRPDAREIVDIFN